MKFEKIFQIVFFLIAFLFITAGLNYRMDAMYSTASALLGVGGAVMLCTAYFVYFRNRK